MTVSALDIKIGTILEYTNRGGKKIPSGDYVYEIVSLVGTSSEYDEDECTEKHLSLKKLVGTFKDLRGEYQEASFSYITDNISTDFRLVCSAENRELRKLQNSLYQCISLGLLDEFKELLLDSEL